MADRTKRLPANVEGNFYVDSTCINCDACRQLAPGSFREVGDRSAVVRQPGSTEEEHRAYQALLACPVGSIGVERRDRGRLQAARTSFPLRLADGVYSCGFNSEKSFGANSFFVEHPAGNWLVDSPRYVKRLIETFEQKGGLRYIFLTHEDDVADADAYAEHFGARRIIHRDDADAAPGAEWIIEGDRDVYLEEGFLAIPVPGHTPGSMALLYREEFLCTGDHMWWDPERQCLAAPQQLVWRETQLVRSLERLLDHRFEWVLAGHGDRVRLGAADMTAQVRRLVEARRMAKGVPAGV